MFSEEKLDANTAQATIEVLDANCNCPFASDVLRLMALTAERLENHWSTDGWPDSGLPVASKCTPHERQTARDRWVLEHPLMRILQAQLDWMMAGRPTGGPKREDSALYWAHERAHHVAHDWKYDI